MIPRFRAIQWYNSLLILVLLAAATGLPPHIVCGPSGFRQSAIKIKQLRHCQGGERGLAGDDSRGNITKIV
jgi:hypothetical protein